MAEDLTITAKYRSEGARHALWLCMFISPFWAVVSSLIFTSGFFRLAALFLSPHHSMLPADTYSQAVSIAGSSIAFFFIFLAGAALSMIFADNRIVTSESGLRLPPFLLLGSLKNNIPWTKITSMQIIGDPDMGLEKLQLRITIDDDHETINLALANMESQDLEKLLQSADVWLPAAAKGPLLDSVREKLAAMPLLGRDRSQKQIYEAELDARFTATAFVPLEPGDQLQKGALSVIKQLSFGGLSAVYLVQQDKTRLYVLKESVVPAETRPEIKQKAWELFRREASILSQLDHPQIVKVLKSFEEKEREYLMLEYLPGLNLRQLIRERGPLDEAEVIKLALSLTAIIDYMHSFLPPVLHRDITPENIILSPDNEPVLIDFGVANEFLGTATGTLVGKHCYISPEQFRGKATTASDFYSLGCTLHYLLTGDDPVPLMQAEPIAINQLVTGQMNELIRDLTNLEADKRVATAKHLRERLLDITDDSTLRADTWAPAVN